MACGLITTPLVNGAVTTPHKVYSYTPKSTNEMGGTAPPIEHVKFKMADDPPNPPEGIDLSFSNFHFSLQMLRQRISLINWQILLLEMVQSLRP